MSYSSFASHPAPGFPKTKAEAENHRTQAPLALQNEAILFSLARFYVCVAFVNMFIIFLTKHFLSRNTTSTVIFSFLHKIPRAAARKQSPGTGRLGSQDQGFLDDNSPPMLGPVLRLPRALHTGPRQSMCSEEQRGLILWESFCLPLLGELDLKSIFIECIGYEKLHGFQVYNSIMLSCVFTTRSQVSFHHHLSPLLTPPPFPLVTILLPVSISLFLFTFVSPFTFLPSPPTPLPS